MTTLYLEPGGDLILNQNGSLQMATGWDEVRQRIIRRAVTTSAGLLPDGTKVWPGYIFDTQYGLGLQLLIGQNPTAEFIQGLQQRLTRAIMTDAAIDTSVPPTITMQKPNPMTTYIVASVVLATGEPGKIALQVA